MIYPNGLIEVNYLLKLVESDEYNVFYDTNKYKKLIIDKEELAFAVSNEILGNGRICYEITDKYFERNPLPDEQKLEITDDFSWKYAGEKNYKICKCSYLGKSPKYPSLELIQFEGDFNSSCFTLGYWQRSDEGYEFKSCGSRMFEHIDEKDLPVIWEALKKADEYLEKKFAREYD